MQKLRLYSLFIFVIFFVSCGDVNPPSPYNVSASDCASEPLSYVCGGDGITYSNSCFASQAGVSVLSQGECSANATVSCVAQDAHITGLCVGNSFGPFWNGSSCVYYTAGCECTGADCDKPFDHITTCNKTYASCSQ